MLRHTLDAVAATTQVVGDGVLVAYMASEGTTQGGTDMNGDADMIDAIAVVVNTATRQKTNLGVAVVSMAFLNQTLFLVVDESLDGTDWNTDLDTSDRVILHVPKGATTATLLATVPNGADPAMVVAGDRLLFVGANVPAAEFDTNLWTVDVPTVGSAPSAPSAVTSTIDDLSNDGVTLAIVDVIEDLVFLSADETVDADLNGDGDALDTNILAAIDAGNPGAQVVSTQKAMAAGSSHFTARQHGGDWTAAFLVDEASEGANLNDPTLFDPSWKPVNCVGFEDADQTDEVMHWFLFTDLFANDRVINTGLVGRTAVTERVHVLISGASRFVGVVSEEADEGGCDLNGDTDAADRIFRWVDATNPTATVLPEIQASKLLAITDGVPSNNGSTAGVIALDPLWVVMVDEAADDRSYDGDILTDNHLVAATDPRSPGQAWNFQHGSSSPGPVSVSWMDENPNGGGRFYAALTEHLLSDLNGDGDTLDSVPTFPEIHTGNVLTFPGVAVALDSDEAAMCSAAGTAFYRVSEAEQGGTDLNGDGDATDFILERVPITGGSPVRMGTLHNLPGQAVVFPPGSASFGSFLFQESAQSSDLNDDGDVTDFVVRYFEF